MTYSRRIYPWLEPDEWTAHGMKILWECYREFSILHLGWVYKFRCWCYIRNKNGAEAAEMSSPLQDVVATTQSSAVSLLYILDRQVSRHERMPVKLLPKKLTGTLERSLEDWRIRQAVEQ